MEDTFFCKLKISFDSNKNNNETGFLTWKMYYICFNLVIKINKNKHYLLLLKNNSFKNININMFNESYFYYNNNFLIPL